jgi:hypothetical protein
MRRVTAAFALAVLGGLPAEAAAYECTRSDKFCVVSVHWTNRTVPYVIRRPADSKFDETQATSTVQSAMRRWTDDVSCSDIRFDPQGVLALDAPASTPNEVVFVNENWEDDHDPAAAGVTRVAYNTATGEIVNAVLDVNERDNEIVTSTTACAGGHDLEAVITHEVGHFLGFAHPCEFMGLLSEEPACPVDVECLDVVGRYGGDNPLPTMWPTIEKCDTQLRTLTNDEIIAVCYVYPDAAPDRQCYQIPDANGDPIIQNSAFGCRTSAGGHAGWLGLGLLLLLLRRK